MASHLNISNIWASPPAQCIYPVSRGFPLLRRRKYCTLGQTFWWRCRMSNPETNSYYAMQFYATAMEFYQVYPVLAADPSQRHDFIAVRLYNLCHALELALKGWLVYTGQFSER